MLRIKKISLDNFKSLNQFSMNLEDFTCLVGLNGSGKSTILQSLDFISQLVKGDISGWLKKRSLTPLNLTSKFGSNRRNISISIIFEFGELNYLWTCIFNCSLLRSTNERIVQFELPTINNYKSSKNLKKHILMKVISSKFKIYGEKALNEKERMDDIFQDYQGSILSSLKDEKLTPVLLELKNYIKNISSLDLLSPHALKQKSRTKDNELGLGGEHLAPFLDSFSKETKQKLLDRLRECYPRIDDLNIKKIRGGWKQIEVIENFVDSKKSNIKIKTSANELNDGLLRILAILSQLYTQKQLLLFDEVENGINSELIEFLLTILMKSSYQIIVTTHSPIILNYITDEIAKKSILFVYKTKEGHTKVKPFFELPSTRKKLEFMGVGEIFVDTKLNDLAEEIEKLRIQEIDENEKIQLMLNDISQEVDLLEKNATEILDEDFDSKIKELREKIKNIQQRAIALSLELIQQEEIVKIFDESNMLEQQLESLNKVK